MYNITAHSRCYFLLDFFTGTSSSLVLLLESELESKLELLESLEELESLSLLESSESELEELLESLLLLLDDCCLQ